MSESKSPFSVQNKATEIIQPEDEYMFPHDGIVWTVQKENCGRIAAYGILFSQILRTDVGYAIHQHSDFYNRVFDRFHRTSQLTNGLYWGTNAQVREAAHQINLAHKPVRGTMNLSDDSVANGQPYNARHSESVKVVWETMVFGALKSYNAFVKPLSREQMDDYVQQSALPIQLLGGKIDTYPKTYGDMMADMEQQVANGHVRAFPFTDELKTKILNPFKPLRTLTGLFESDAEALAGGFMHPAYRDVMFDWTDERQHRFEVLCGGLKAVYQHLPNSVRYKQEYLEYMRTHPQAQPTAVAS